jgi:hypothetical protein
MRECPRTHIDTLSHHLSSCPSLAWRTKSLITGHDPISALPWFTPPLLGQIPGRCEPSYFGGNRHELGNNTRTMRNATDFWRSRHISSRRPYQLWRSAKTVNLFQASGKTEWIQICVQSPLVTSAERASEPSRRSMPYAFTLSMNTPG